MSAYKAAFQDSKFMPTEALAFHKPDVFNFLLNSNTIRQKTTAIN